jgi:hypothetical protein
MVRQPLAWSCDIGVMDTGWRNHHCEASPRSTKCFRLFERPCCSVVWDRGGGGAGRTQCVEPYLWLAKHGFIRRWWFRKVLYRWDDRPLRQS